MSASDHKRSTVDIIRCTLRNHEAQFMPGAASRIAGQLDKRFAVRERHYLDHGWVDEAERLISSEKLTLKKLEEHNVTIKTLVAWQMWMLYRDEMI
jgi:hypothetical protein